MRFAEAAKQAFSFLEHANFRLAQTGPARLQYETAQSFVTIEWDARSGELNVFVGLQPRKGEAADAFSLTDVLAMQGIDVPERKMPFQVAEESRLRPFLEKLAEDTQVNAQPALAGDRMFFRRLQAFRSGKAQTYMRDMRLRRVRSEAENAWQKRELDKVVNLYTSIEKDLSESERGKLDYARKHNSQ